MIWSTQDLFSDSVQYTEWRVQVKDGLGEYYSINSKSNEIANIYMCSQERNYVPITEGGIKSNKSS